MKVFGGLLLCLLVSCKASYRLQASTPGSPRLTGTEFYKVAAAFDWKQRDSLALQEILSGNLPAFLKRFVAVHTSVIDSTSGKRINATYFVSPDYLT